MPDVPERLAGEALAWFQVTVTSDAASEGRCPGLTVEGGNGGWRGYRGRRDDQATAKLRQAVSHQRDNASARGRWRGGISD